MRQTLRQSGFTMIELLIVMAVLLILLGGFMSLLSLGRRSSADARTQGLLTQLQTAISMYERDRGAPPPETITGDAKKQIEGAKNLIYHLCIQHKVKYTDSDGHERVNTYGPYLEPKRELLEDGEKSRLGIKDDEGYAKWRDKLTPVVSSDDLPVLRDGYGNPIYYDLLKNDPLDTPGTGKDPRGGNPGNPGGFDLWSLGSDGKPGKDDMTNWSKR